MGPLWYILHSPRNRVFCFTRKIALPHSLEGSGTSTMQCDLPATVTWAKCGKIYWDPRSKTCQTLPRSLTSEPKSSPRAGERVSGKSKWKEAKKQKDAKPECKGILNIAPFNFVGSQP